jgi:WD40 repeat protein
MTSDGNYIVSGSADNTIRVWDYKSGDCLRILEGHTGTVRTIHVNSREFYAISVSHDHTIRQWNLATGECLRIIRGHRGAVLSLAVTADGRYAVSGSADTTMRLWDMRNGRCLRTFDLDTSFDNVRLCVAITPDGHKAATQLLRGDMWVWNLRGIEAEMGKWALSRPRGESEVRQATSAVQAEINQVQAALAADQLQLAGLALRRARSQTGFERDPALLKKWHQTGQRYGKRAGILSGHCLHVLNGGGLGLAVSGDGHSLVSMSMDVTIHLWDLATGKCVRSIDELEGEDEYPCEPLVLSPKDHSVLSNCSDYSLRLWDLERGDCIRTFQGHEQDVKVVAMTPDGQYALSGSDDKTLRMWDIPSGRCLHVFEGHEKYVNALRLTPDGQHAISGSGDNSIRLWELATGRCLRVLEDAHSPLLTPDGRYAVLGGAKLRLWELVPERV